MKKTKEQLEKENARLSERVEALVKVDEEVREKLSRLVGTPTYKTNYFGETNVVPLSWIEIAFAIGELKADADYSCVLEAKERFRQEAEELRQKLEELREGIS